MGRGMQLRAGASTFFRDTRAPTEQFFGSSRYVVVAIEHMTRLKPLVRTTDLDVEALPSGQPSVDFVAHRVVVLGES